MEEEEKEEVTSVKDNENMNEKPLAIKTDEQKKLCGDIFAAITLASQSDN